MKIVANPEVVRAEMERRDWKERDLAQAMQCSIGTVARILGGAESVHRSTQLSLYGAFRGRIRLTELFMLALDEGDDACADDPALEDLRYREPVAA